MALASLMDIYKRFYGARALLYSTHGGISEIP